MSDTFDPGAGWREVDRPEAAMHAEVVSYRSPRGDSPRVRTWVREEPVPPLPTAEYTTVRVEWRDLERQTSIAILDRGLWRIGDHRAFGSEQLRAVIIGFEVLAEPRMSEGGIPYETDAAFEERIRRETAQAVITALRAKTSMVGKILADELELDLGLKS